MAPSRPLARFLELAGQLKAAWADAKEFFSENWNDYRDNERLEIAEDQLDQALAGAEAILKAFAKLPGKSTSQSVPLRPSVAPIGPPLLPPRRPAPAQREEAVAVPPLRRPAHREEEENAPWHKRQRTNASSHNDVEPARRPEKEPARPRTTREWRDFRNIERQAKYEANWVPGRTSSHNFYGNILPTELASFPQERLRDLLHGTIDRWLHNRQKKKVGSINSSGDTFGPLDLLEKSDKFSVIRAHIDPPIENLAHFISDNFGDIIMEDLDGQTMISKKRLDIESDEYKQQYQELLEGFLSTLPTADFTEEELRLRNAVITFLENWQGESAPMVTEAYNSNHVDGIEVTLAMWLLLPWQIKLQDWIDHRMGGEIQLKEAGGSFSLHLIA